ncbi:organic solute transporter subunit alpha-like [Ciona intestinalis]
MAATETTAEVNFTTVNFTTAPPQEPWDCTRVHNSMELWQRFSEGGSYYYGVMSVPLIILVLLVIIYIDEVNFLLKDSVYTKRTRYSIWVLSSFPFLGVCYTTGLFVPRTAEVVSYAGGYYYAISLKKFTAYCLHLYGGKEAMVDALKGDKVVSSNPFPCCFVCCCCNQPLSLERLRILDWIIYQVVWIYPLFGFLQVLVAVEYAGRPSAGLAFTMFIFGGVCTCSSFICLYGYVIMGRASRFVLKQFHFRGKFAFIQILVGFNTLQRILISFLSFFKEIPCGFPYPDKEQAFLYHSYIILIEILLISLVLRHFYKNSEHGCIVEKTEVESSVYTKKEELSAFSNKAIKMKTVDENNKQVYTEEV